MKVANRRPALAQKAHGPHSPKRNATRREQDRLDTPLPVGKKANKRIGVELPAVGRSKAKAKAQTTAPVSIFSMPPAELGALLEREIKDAFAFCRHCKRTFTFFGGARVKEDDPFFGQGVEWGEAMTLMNLAAAKGSDFLIRAIQSGRFSEATCRAATAAVMGAGVGSYGPDQVVRTLIAGGGMYGPRALERAMSTLAARRLDPERVQLLAAVTTTGAGPGMMEAVPLGVLAARDKLALIFPELVDELKEHTQTQGSRIKLPFEQKTNDSVELLHEYVHFLARRLALTEQAAGFVVFPGGFGTLNELFEVMHAGRPTALHSKSFWSGIADALCTAWRKRGLATESQMRQLKVTDSIDEGLSHLLDAASESPSLAPTSARAKKMAKEAARTIHKLAGLPPAVTFLGGRRLSMDDPEVDVAVRLAARLGDNGTAVRVGGDTAFFQAVADAARGKKGKGKVQAFTHRKPGGVDKKRLAKMAQVVDVVDSFRIHKLMTYENAEALVALPGGVGTLDEVFELATLMQCKKVQPRPLILVGREFWQPILDAMKAAMLDGDSKMIADNDMDYFTVVDDEAEAYAAITAQRSSAAAAG